jgi:hypothetical protein
MWIRGQYAGDVFHKRLANNENKLIIVMKIILLGCIYETVINILKQYTAFHLQGKSMLSVEKCCTDTPSLQSTRQNISILLIGVEVSTMLGQLIVSQHFMEPGGSIPNSQELSTCSYPGPDQSSPHRPIPTLKDPS